jgi:hypothetical protein
MLIRLRDNQNKLFIKDYLDIDFDMSVSKKGDEYFVKVNRQYTLDDVFKTEEAAEGAMLTLADNRDQLENEIRHY